MRKSIDRILEVTLITIMTLMVINVLWQVFTRYLMSEPSSFTDELSRYLMIWLGILGAAYVSGKNMHVAIDIVPSRSSPSARKRMKTMVLLAIISFAFFVMIIGGIRLVYISATLGQLSPALQIPLAAIYMVIPISGLLVIYYKIHDLKQLRNA